jgi:hypothetical protein
MGDPFDPGNAFIGGVSERCGIERLARGYVACGSLLLRFKCALVPMSSQGESRSTTAGASSPTPHSVVQERLASDGASIVGSTPEVLARTIEADIARWGKVIRQNGITLEQVPALARKSMRTAPSYGTVPYCFHRKNAKAPLLRFQYRPPRPPRFSARAIARAMTRLAGDACPALAMRPGVADRDACPPDRGSVREWLRSPAICGQTGRSDADQSACRPAHSEIQ